VHDARSASNASTNASTSATAAGTGVAPDAHRRTVRTSAPTRSAIRVCQRNQMVLA